MSQEMQPRPVVLYPPPANPSEREFMDFRPMPVEQVEEQDADPKVSSAPESVPSSQSEMELEPGTVKEESASVPQVPNVSAVKASIPPKEDGNSTPTS